jgi:hypothetical protein
VKLTLVPTVGLALAEQVLQPPAAVPMAANDWRLDALLIGDGRVLRAESRESVD